MWKNDNVCSWCHHPINPRVPRFGIAGDSLSGRLYITVTSAWWVAAAVLTFKNVAEMQRMDAMSAPKSLSGTLDKAPSNKANNRRRGAEDMVSVSSYFVCSFYLVFALHLYLFRCSSDSSQTLLITPLPCLSSSSWLTHRLEEAAPGGSVGVRQCAARSLSPFLSITFFFPLHFQRIWFHRSSKCLSICIHCAYASPICPLAPCRVISLFSLSLGLFPVSLCLSLTRLVTHSSWFSSPMGFHLLKRRMCRSTVTRAPREWRRLSSETRKENHWMQDRRWF